MDFLPQTVANASAIETRAIACSSVGTESTATSGPLHRDVDWDAQTIVKEYLREQSEAFRELSDLCKEVGIRYVLPSTRITPS